MASTSVIGNLSSSTLLTPACPRLHGHSQRCVDPHAALLVQEEGAPRHVFLATDDDSVITR